MAADPKKTETRDTEMIKPKVQEAAATPKVSLDDALKFLLANFTPAQVAAALAGAEAKKGPPELAPEHKGTKKYRLTAPHYRLGTMYAPGSIIEVTDEKPSVTWEPYTGEPVAGPAIADLSTGASRPSDKEI